MSWEELHLCTRLLGAGWQVRCFPEIEVWHCRASRTVPPAHTYLGVRNYLWYVWSLYPWPYCMWETLHAVGSGLRLTMQGRLRARVWLSALCGALYGWQRIRSQRHPVSPETIKRLRLLRRQGHTHAAVPTFREFPSIDPALGDATP